LPHTVQCTNELMDSIR